MTAENLGYRIGRICVALIITSMTALVSNLAYGYAAILLLGGVIGASKGSIESLIAAGVSAAAVAGAEMLMSRPGYASMAGATQLAVTVALAYVMFGRFSKSGKVMPAGMVCGLSVVMALCFLARLYSVFARVSSKSK